VRVCYSKNNSSQHISSDGVKARAPEAIGIKAKAVVHLRPKPTCKAKDNVINRDQGHDEYHFP